MKVVVLVLLGAAIAMGIQMLWKSAETRKKPCVVVEDSRSLEDEINKHYSNGYRVKGAGSAMGIGSRGSSYSTIVVMCR